jgi:outer membrane protein assembly factor BamD
MNRILTFFLFIVLAVSCSSPEKLGGDAAENLYLHAQKNVKNGQYLLAIDRLDELKATFPLSSFVQKAAILKGEALFKQENYQDAIDVFMNFQTLNPGYPGLDYIQWMIAEAYFKSMPDTIDRDLSMAYEAISSYQKLLSDYPDSKFLKNIKSRLVECQKFIYGRELYIADFYFKTKKFVASASRYKGILSSDAPIEMKKKAYKNYVFSLYKNKSFKDCIEALKTNSVVGFIADTEEVALKKDCMSGIKKD